MSEITLNDVFSEIAMVDEVVLLLDIRCEEGTEGDVGDMGAEDVVDGIGGGEVVAVERNKGRRFLCREGWYYVLSFLDCFLRILAATEEQHEELVERL